MASARATVACVELAAEMMNRLPMVTWDRCVRPGDWLIVYGWIDRAQDTRKDFVVVEFYDGELYGATTSSARWSAEISQQLFAGAGHSDCERIRDVLGDRVHRTVGP